MKILRTILASIFLVVAVTLIIAMKMPSEWSTARRLGIDSPPETIFPLLVDLRRWSDWAIWFEHDPNMQITYSNPSFGIGAHYIWSGNRSVGEGRLELDKIVNERVLSFHLEMNQGGFLTQGRIVLDPLEHGTRVTWTFGGSLGNDPFARLNRRHLENAVGETLQANLEKLKRIVEDAVPPSPSVKSIAPSP